MNVSMDITELARQAHEAMEVTRAARHEGGYRDRPAKTEPIPGFFSLYNTKTGQSKIVIYHPESGYVFKSMGWSGQTHPTSLSRRYVGTVTLCDDLVFPVRLPEFHYVEINGETIEVQEYVNGLPCGCTDSWCDCSYAVKRATRCSDSHQGNWMIVDNEIVLFDFDGIKI